MFIERIMRMQRPNRFVRNRHSSHCTYTHRKVYIAASWETVFLLFHGDLIFVPRRCLGFVLRIRRSGLGEMEKTCECLNLNWVFWLFWVCLDGAWGLVQQIWSMFSLDICRGLLVFWNYVQALIRFFLALCILITKKFKREICWWDLHFLRASKCLIPND